MVDELLFEGYQIGLLFGLKPWQCNEAIRIYENIRLNPRWDSRRSNHGLLIDCLFIKAKQYKTGITVKKAVKITTDYNGVGTQPKPNQWVTHYTH